MSFQSEVDKLFAGTLYQNYNKELSAVVGKVIASNELEKNINLEKDDEYEK